MEIGGGKFWAFLTAMHVLGMAIGAQSLTGRVVDGKAVPVSGAKVALSLAKINVTTGADGSFELKAGSAILIRDGRDGQAGQGQGGEATGGGTPLAAISIHGDRVHLDVTSPQSLAIVLYALDGKRTATLADRFFADGAYDFPLPPAASGRNPGLRILRIHSGLGDVSAITPSLSTALPKGSASAAAADTLSITKLGYYTAKITLESLLSRNLGDLVLQQDVLFSRNANYDVYDQIVLEASGKHNLDTSGAMVVKAMMVIESSFNAKAISMYDTQLPCGTHSYGLIQVTPGCERGYATLPAGTKVTATISGGLNGNAAVLAYADPADKASGNTIVMENNIIIDLVTDPASPFWAMSAFNPAYSIDNGAKALADVRSEMKSRFQGCTEANYMAMALAGYNQGSGTVSGCASYSANGTNYANSVLAQYRSFCKLAGLTAVY